MITQFKRGCFILLFSKYIFRDKKQKKARHCERACECGNLMGFCPVLFTGFVDVSWDCFYLRLGVNSSQ